MQHKFNLVEIFQNNEVSARYLESEAIEGVQARQYHRYGLDSHSDLTDYPQLVKDIVAAFPLVEVEHGEGAHLDVSKIRIMADSQGQFRYDVVAHIVENGKTVVCERHASIVVDCLEDITAHPEKVQKAAALIFKPEVKEAYIASLPTVDEPVTDWRQVTVDLPVMIKNPDYDAEVEGSLEKIQKTETVLVDVEETTVLEGAVQKVVKAHQAKQEQGAVETIGVTDESGAKVMEEYDTGEVVTKIQYKGELYKNAAELLAL